MTAQKTDEHIYHVTLDNHTPPRSEDTGTLETWTRPDGSDSYRLPGGLSRFPAIVRDGGRAVFLVDDGRTVRPLYVAGWSVKEDAVFLDDMPVSIRPDGTPLLREDNGRPVDYSTWQLGPRTAYHLKIKEV